MVKMAYIIAGIALVVALAIVGAVIYYQGDVPGFNAIAPLISSSDNAFGRSNGTVTALQAFSAADNNVNVKNWKAGNKNVSIAQISSDFCADGLSSTWTVTYASDTDEAAAHVENGTMRGVTITKTPERLYPIQNTPVNGLIDSPRAFEIAAGAMMNAGVNTIGPASATLARSTLRNSGGWRPAL